MASLKELFISELRNEAANTRKELLLVPVASKDWAPHAKSMKLGRLALHVAELGTWASMTVTTTELDFAKGYTPSPDFNTVEELAAFHDATIAKAIADIESVSEESLYESWTLRNGEQIYFTMPRHLVIRSMVLNHIVHHRAQLGVYLRLLDVKLPGMYGPSADDRP